VFRLMVVEAERVCRVLEKLLRRTLGLTRPIIGSPHTPGQLENCMAFAASSIWAVGHPAARVLKAFSPRKGRYTSRTKALSE
jgi:hypothetical protein